MYSKWFIVLLAVFSLKIQKLQCFDFYTAAVVEYNPYYDVNEVNMVKTNLENYLKLIEEASRKGAHIIVFPEGGLVTRNITTEVPPPDELVVPCTEGIYVGSILKNFSCAAKEHKIHVVVNLLEERSIRDSDDVEKKVRYNTNVVFDNFGIVIARYAKFNLFDESNVNRTEAAEISYFTTNFGVKFGTFTCFDILFSEPALRLIDQYKITDFVFPTQWFSELPFLTALQAQQGWAEANNVNLLASGVNNPRKGSTGSGIFNGIYGPLVSYMTEKKGSKLFLANVPIISQYDRPILPQRRVPVATEIGNVSIEKNSHNKSKLIEEEFSLLSDQIELFDSEKIEHDTDFSSEICSHDNFCCNFKVRVEKIAKDDKGYNYRAVVLNGVRKFGEKFAGGVQVCGVILCNGPKLANCTKRVPKHSGIFEFKNIEISGSFKLRNSLQFPSTLTDGPNLKPLEPHKYMYIVKENETEKLILMKLDWFVNNLNTFAIWGRDFTRDGRKPSLPVSSATSLKQISICLIISWILSFATLK